MSVKISLIGAGSGIFSINLIKDLCLAKNLSDSRICLMDINEDRLDDIYRMCVRYAEEAGTDLEITKTTDRLECLRSADFVVNTALAGGYERLKEGWKVAQKWGYRFGGSFHIVHDESFWVNFYQLRLMEEIYHDMQKVCPDAWYIMVSNPVMGGVTYLTRKYKGIKLAGMCHGYGGVYRLCELLGLERENVTFQVPGINHFVWLNSFYYKGENAYPLLDQWIAEKSEDYFKTCRYSDDFGPKAIDLYQKYGVMPIGDTCTPGGGSWGYWYHTDGEVQEVWREDPDHFYEEYFQTSQKHVEDIHRAAHDDSIKMMDFFSKVPSDEPMIPLIEALACDVERVVIVNIANTYQYVEGVPEDFEVEIPALVSKRGIQGIHTLPLPKMVQSHMKRDRIASVEMELEAYERGSRELLTELIMMDPFTRSREQAEGFLNELLELPFLQEMKGYYN